MERPTPAEDRARRARYLALWAEAEALLAAADPCAFVGDHCAAGLPDGCCLCDEHLPGEPCSRQSLGCKVHLCAWARKRHPALARALARIQRVAEAEGFSTEIFSTFDEP